ncbi:hypothetical protein QNN03_12600 [Streptomyces sp. GXMU-J15]|uniref:Extensin n=1 Tax=Streptomyces fuscus TaxID=3048495 RepID=A0ABT7J0H8_9ACTN|nr:hypothetical protein [Streptomyces fuscus]MDL2077282.1 hypothetical protein [Streptomyces fuscus]
MADERFRWLDPETAERLLNGEPLDAVDAADRDEAERLAKTLEALTAEPAPISTELPGEAAALAAFRAARTPRDAASGAPAGEDAADVGLVRIGTPVERTRAPRWARRARFGLAAALAVGMLGGVAVAAGTGALPTPFDGDEPTPAASVSAAAPDRPQTSPSPKNTLGGEPPSGRELSGTVQPPATPHRPGTRPDPTPGDGHKDTDEGWSRTAVAAACRDFRAGRHLSDERRQALETLAGHPGRVAKYCKGLLAGFGGDHERTKPDGPGKDHDGDDDQDDDDRDRGRGHGNGHGHGKDHDGDGHGRNHGRGDDRHARSTATPADSPAAAALARAQRPAR